MITKVTTFFNLYKVPLFNFECLPTNLSKLKFNMLYLNNIVDFNFYKVNVLKSLEGYRHSVFT